MFAFFNRPYAHSIDVIVSLLNNSSIPRCDCLSRIAGRMGYYNNNYYHLK